MKQFIKDALVGLKFLGIVVVSVSILVCVMIGMFHIAFMFPRIVLSIAGTGAILLFSAKVGADISEGEKFAELRAESDAQRKEDLKRRL